MNIVHLTRPGHSKNKMVQDYVRLGGSPRASKNAVKAAKAYAFLEGKKYIEKHHLERVLYPILRHRLLLNYNAEVDNISTDSIIETPYQNPFIKAL